MSPIQWLSYYVLDAKECALLLVVVENLLLNHLIQNIQFNDVCALHEYVEVFYRIIEAPLCVIP